MYSIRIQSEVEGFEEDLQSSLVFIMEEERRKRKLEDEADPGEVKFVGSASSSQASEESPEIILLENEEFEVTHITSSSPLDKSIFHVINKSLSIP